MKAKTKKAPSLKEFSLTYPGEYTNEIGEPCVSTANLHLTFKCDDKKNTVTVRIPKKNKPNRYKTLTKQLKGDLEDFSKNLDFCRLKRNELFFCEYGVVFSAKNAKKTKSEIVITTSTGIQGLTVSKPENMFKVSHMTNGKKSHKNFPLANYGSEEAAYFEASKYLDLISGEKPLSFEDYLSRKPEKIFSDFGTPIFEFKTRKMREIKESSKLNKVGVEVVAESRLVGFFVNYFTDLGRGSKKGQRRMSFNARKLGENEAFIRACRARDELINNPISKDEFYLTLKPENIFKGLL